MAGQAALVRIDDGHLDRLAATLAPTAPEPFPEERFDGDLAEVVAAVVWWNAVNFGSGWFPHVRKLNGLSGARTLATRWHDHVADDPAAALDVGRMAAIDRAAVAAIFGQSCGGDVVGLLDAFVAAWRELARFLIEHYDGSPMALVEDASRSAAALAERLAPLPCWHDVHRHGALEVPIFKRAQIVGSQLASATAATGPAAFDDLDRLTLFADNLVPHVLRLEGVLVVDPAVVARIDAGDELVSGEPAEVELRAVAIHAVEELAARTGATPASIDHQLWQRGQQPVFKAQPRHRCRCPFY